MLADPANLKASVGAPTSCTRLAEPSNEIGAVALPFRLMTKWTGGGYSVKVSGPVITGAPTVLPISVIHCACVIVSVGSAVGCETVRAKSPATCACLIGSVGLVRAPTVLPKRMT